MGLSGGLARLPLSLHGRIINLSGPVGNNGEIPGFGERYRVRIMGYHTADTDALPDEELPWAYIMYPVTAGTGSRSSSQSANITQGDFVFGFFMDGEDAQMPVIMGLLGNNEYATGSKNITNQDLFLSVDLQNQINFQDILLK